jgi:hypothetical protein
VHNSGKPPKWEGVALERIAGKPAFSIQPPPYVTPEIVEFVRERLAQSREGIRV